MVWKDEIVMAVFKAAVEMNAAVEDTTKMILNNCNCRNRFILIIQLHNYIILSYESLTNRILEYK